MEKEYGVNTNLNYFTLDGINTGLNYDGDLLNNYKSIIANENDFILRLKNKLTIAFSN
jgi:hypothetical protein